MNSEQMQEVLDWLYTYLPEYDVDDNNDISGRLGEIDLKINSLDFSEMGFEGSFLLLIRASLDIEGQYLRADNEFKLWLPSLVQGFADKPEVKIELRPRNDDSEEVQIVFSVGHPNLEPDDILRALNEVANLCRSHNSLALAMQEMRDNFFSGF